MPFKSKAQQKWMYANEPDMAERWSDHTPDHKSLPEKVKKKKNRKKKAGDALATAWEAIKAPVAAASDAITTRENKRRKEEEQLQRAVDRNTRERMARRIAAARVPKMGAYDPPSPLSNRQDDMKEVVYKSLRKQAVAKKLCDLFGDSDPKSHPKGVKVVKRTVKMTPLATVKIKGKREKKAYLELRFCKPQRLKLACILFEKTVEKLEKKADAARVQGLMSQGLDPQTAIRQAYPDWDDNQVKNEASKFPGLNKQGAALEKGREKVAQRAVSKFLKPKKVPKPPTPPRSLGQPGNQRGYYDSTGKFKWRPERPWDRFEENLVFTAGAGTLGGLGYGGLQLLFRDTEQDQIDTERIMKKRRAAERLKTPGGGWPTHTLGPGWREKLTADKPADKTTVDIEKQNIDKYANTELIAHLARAAARGEEVKLAFDFGSIGDTVKGYWEGLSPEARSSIIGGVGGLGVGALGGGLLGGGKGALIGALAGGGLGALGGRTYDPLLSYFKKLTGKEEEPSTPRQNTAQAKPRTDLQNYGPPGEYPQEMLDTMNANFPT